jgi:hypothetical protein
MKKHVRLILSAMGLLLALSYTSCSASKNVAADAVVLTQAIDTGKWVFTVSTIIPQGGRTREPNGFYTVNYSPQELNVYLPYFGTGYSGSDAYGGNNPLSFVTKEFKMDKQRLKDDKWRIVFTAINQQQVQSMTFDIFDNGSASLDVILTSRSPISYRGNVRVKK